MAVDQHLAALHIVEARDEADERGLARAGRADEGDALARRDLERDALEHPLAGIVGEPDVAELDLAAHLLQRRRCFGIFQGDWLVQHAEDALGTGHRRLQDGVLVGQVAHRQEEAVDVLQEGHQRAERQRLRDRQHLAAADADDERGGDCREHVDHWQKEREEEERAHRDLHDNRGLGRRNERSCAPRG